MGDLVRDLVLRNARLMGGRELVDVVISGGRIAAVGPKFEQSREPSAAIEELDLDGRWLMPGLWDAHVHFTQWARFRSRADVSGSASAAEAISRLVAATDAGVAVGGLLVGRGFQDALWPDAMTGEALDLAFGGRPVVIISHDLHCVWLNDSAAMRLGATDSGVLREAEAFAVQIALDAAASPAKDERALRDAVAEANSRGVVGIRDLEMADNPRIWAARVADGMDALRVDACIYPEHLAASDTRGLVGGDVVPGTGGLVTVGALKVFADGSLNTLTALTHEHYGRAGGEPSLGHAAHSPEGLAALLTAATERRLSVALHAIGDAAVTRALDAFEATRARGTIEHAQLVAAKDLSRFAQLNIAASVQPQHAIDDRDVTDAVWADRADRAFAYRSLHDAGARLLFGSDAPVAPLDPWVTLAAAISRTADDRPSWHPEQRLDAATAIGASVRTAVAVGEPADLIAVDGDPLVGVARNEISVALTLLGGRVTYSAS